LARVVCLVPRETSHGAQRQNVTPILAGAAALSLSCSATSHLQPAVSGTRSKGALEDAERYVKGRAYPEDFAEAASPPAQTKDSRSAGETQELRGLSVQEIELWLKGEAQADAGDTPFAESDALEEQAGVARSEFDHAVYEEYVRGFDDVPTLHDAVGMPPRRVVPPDFRRGERPDQRKERRLDAQSLREARTADLEGSYLEYEQPEPARGANKKPKRGRPRKSGKRKKR